MTSKTIYKEMESLKKVFDVVRLVDASRTKAFNLSDDGSLIEDEYSCFSIWNKGHRCDNCISVKACAAKSDLTKFEFRDDEIFFVIAKYMVIDSDPYVLEMGKLIDDKTLFGAYGKNDFIEKITSYNKKIYTDSLTGCYNRRYFDEELVGMNSITAVAVLDIDDFKRVNDVFGHDAGDATLKALSEVILNNVRDKDSVMRLGGDEFIIAFSEMPKDVLYSKLERLREKIESIRVDGYPGLHITTSIGGCCCNEYSSGIFKAADELMYEAKKTKNTVVVNE